MKPAYAFLAEQLVPVDLPGLEREGRGRHGVRTPASRENAEAHLSGVEPDARVATNAVEFPPDDVRQIDTDLHDQVFNQPTEIIDRERRDYSRALAPALA